MFQPCPNCGFLVALITPKSGATEQRCPRCGQIIVVDAASADRPAPRPPQSADTGRTHAAASAGSLRAPRPAQLEPMPGLVRAQDDRVHTADPREAADHDRAPVDAHPRSAPDTQAPAPQRPSSAPPVAAAPDAPARHAPSFARRADPSAASRPRQWPLHAASAALAVALLLQLVLAQRDALAVQPRWRPAVEALCGVFGCAVPAWREPSAFTMLDRSVQPKPGAPGVLTARASFRNDARWPQPWPTLVLSLSGVDGTPLGARAFAPHEYAGAATGVLEPGQAASVQLDVLEPGPGVVAFAFDFR